MGEASKTFTDYKNGWVTIKGKKKVKFRKYVADLAKNLSKVNNEKYGVNRADLIREFNINRDITDVDKFYMNELIKQLDKTEQALQMIKNDTDGKEPNK